MKRYATLTPIGERPPTASYLHNCPHCSWQFWSKDNLARHIERKHAVD